MKVGDLVKMKRGYSTCGFVIKIDKDHYGARQAFKVSKVERGKAIRPNMVDVIAPTRDGIQDRVLVLWSEDEEFTHSYESSSTLEVISES